MTNGLQSAEVIVVGGGPSGLAAAYTLQKAGAKVRLLEKSDRVGGKLSSRTRDGFKMEQGALFATSGYTTLLRLAEEVGLAEQLVPANFVLAQIRDGKVHHLDGNHPLSSFLKTRLLSPQAKVEAAFKLLPEFLRARRAGYEELPACGKFDTQTVAQWAEGRLSEELRTYLVDGVLRGMFGTRSESASRVDFLALLNILGGSRLMGFENGMSAYAEALARNLEVQCGADVLKVEVSVDGVNVEWQDAAGQPRCERAAACVIAVPAATAQQIYPELDPWRQQFLKKVRHGKQLILSIALKRPPANIRASYIMVPKTAHPFVSGIMVDHNKMPGRVPEGKGLLSVAVMDHWCEENWHRGDEDLAEDLLDAVDSLLPGTRESMEFLELNRWFLEYSRGGFYRDLAAFRAACEYDKRVQLAGDFHSMGGLEPATITGVKAAERILANKLAS